MRNTLKRLGASVALGVAMLAGAAQQAAAYYEEIQIWVCELAEIEYVPGREEPILWYDCTLVYWEITWDA